MKKLLKWVAVLLGVFLGIGGTLVLAYLMDWPLQWVGVGWVGVTGVVCAVIGLLRWRSRRQTAAAVEEHQAPDTARGRALAERWKEFVQTLRKARIKGGIDPVGEAPWYLVLGPGGCGKTALVSEAGVSGPEPGGEPGSGFRWRLLEQGVVLDAPGTYAVPRDPEDEEEWRAFLALVRRTRKSEPLNGVLIAVSAETLLGAERSELQKLGAALAKRLDEMATGLGVVVPVYLLVTQCDRISGMVRFFQAFPAPVRDQAWGGLNDLREAGPPALAFLERVCGQIYGRLRELRLTLLGESETDPLHPEAYLFPEEFRALEEPLRNLLGTVFEDNPYREPAFCRGLYFCSARQEGMPVSRFLPGLGLEGEQLAASGTGHGWFLKGFFTAVLARDRALVSPTSKAIGWSRLTLNVGLSIWLVVCIVLGALLSVTFVQDLRTIRMVAGEIPSSPYLGQEFAANLGMIDQLREAIEGARARDAERWLPRLGLTQSTRLIRQMESVFCGRFGKGILEPLDRELDLSLDRVAVGGAPQEVARHVDYMSRRSSLLQIASAEDVSADALSGAAVPAFALVLGRLSGDAGEGAVQQVEREFLAYLRWQADRRVLEENLAAEQKRIQGFLSRRSIGFAWLDDWANLQTDLEEATAVPYWGDDVPLDGGGILHVERAYTPDGWEKIHRFMGEIQASLTGEAEVREVLEQFESAYRTEYLHQWERFLAGFPDGFHRWFERARQVDLVGKLAAPDSPYAQVLAYVPEALAPAVQLTRAGEQLPAWVSLVYHYERLADPEYQRELKGGEGVLGRWTSKSGKALGNLKTRLRGETDDQKLEKRDRQAYPHLTVYQETLRQVAAQASSPRAAHQMARDTYLEAEALVGEPGKPANKNVWALKKLRSVVSSGNPQEKVFWDLFERPLEQVWSVVLDQAQLDLEEQWQEKVLAEGKGLSGWELVEVLQGPEGKVWSFQEQALAPFLKKSGNRGYLPRTLYGDGLEFSPGFLQLLTRGRLSGQALRGEYRVQVAALPTDANAGATQQPH
ncbi:MAG TPA: type VI secretion protein IcmF/TssM N-terminal domain-containing protein, partial [Deferrisomatales bacterium]|nr:type VI secretion protein IcmF/TssM N-terminal domain-containing protein [Deferrisomatales bacterium]